MKQILDYVKLYNIDLWILLIVIVLLIVVWNLYMKERRITKKAVKSIDNERKFYKTFVGKDENFYVYINNEMRVLYVSPNFEKMTGIADDRIYVDIEVLKNLVSGKKAREITEKVKKWDKTTNLEIEVEYFPQTTKETRYAKVYFLPDSDKNGCVLKFKDITAYHEELQKINEKLKSAEKESQAKTDFLSNMSHEIRTPMNGILGMLSLAKAHEVNPDLVDEYLNKAENLSQFLLRLINDILDMSRIESGKMQLENKRFSMQALSMKIDNMFKGTAKEKGINWTVEMQDFDTKYVVGDEMRLSQVIVNFISNALKFTPAGGYVTVTFKQMEIIENKMHFMVRVRDTGKGIKKDFISKIFKPFEQEDASTAHNYGGSGLGMAISDNIVKLMNGQILIESEEGKGSEFVVYLALPVAKNQEEEQITVENNDSNIEFSIEGVKILLAEDNDINAEVAKEILEMHGAVITRASNGKEAVDMFADNSQGTFDVILMDIQMPEMDGWEATKTIRQLQREDADIPIIAMTANAFIEDQRHSIEVGMNGHVNKPVNYKEIKQIIGKCLNKK